MKPLFKIFIFIVFSTICLTACDKEKIEYPYTEHGVEYLGFKDGLTSSSSDEAFSDGLNEVLQTYIANNLNAETDFTIDKVTYEFVDFQNITGGIPNFIWNLFWDDLNEYRYSSSVGSCWGFSYCEIPKKRKTGTAWVIYAIVKQQGYEVLYVAVKGNIVPKKSKNKSGKIQDIDTFSKEILLECNGSIIDFMPADYKTKRR